MATSGSVTVTAPTSSSIKTTASWSVSSTNYANNNYTVKFTASSSGSVSAWTVRVYKDSTTYWQYTGSGGTQTKSLTFSSGASFSVYVVVQYTVAGSGTVIPVSKSASFTLNTIDRKSSPTLSASSVTLGNSITLTTNRKASSFTHTISGGFSTSSLTTLASNVGASTSLSFPIDDSRHLASNIPDSTSKSYIIRTTTYSGGTSVGSVDKTITLNVPASLKPSIGTLYPEDTWCYSNLGKFYNKYSILRMHASETLSYSSPIKSRTLTFNGETVSSTSSATLTMSKAMSFDSIPSTAPTATFTITDKRGRSASATVSIPVISYNKNYFSGVNAYRVDANGDADSEGTYIKVTGTYTKNSVPDSNNNEQNFVYRAIYVDNTKVYESGNITTTDANNQPVILGIDTSGSYSASNTYSVKVMYGDGVSGYQTTSVISVPSALRPISISEDGQGIAFGKPCTKNGMEIASVYTPVEIHGALKVDSKTQTQKNLGIVSGTISGDSVSSGGIKDFPISFGGAFTSAPTVVVGFFTNADQGNFGRCCCAVLMSSLTASGCTIRIYNGDAQGRSPRCNWIAVGY